MAEFLLAAVPLPEFWLVGMPAFMAGFIMGRLGDVRHPWRKR